MPRSALVASLALAVLGCNGAPASTPDASVDAAGDAASPARLRRVILVIADDLGPDALTVYNDRDRDGRGDDGLTRPSTPTIDHLCRDGQRYLRAWSNPTCTPTRGTITTGRHGFRTGMLSVAMGNSYTIKPTEVTLPQRLTASVPDVALALVGKWHLGITQALGGVSAPNKMGWPHYVGSPSGDLSDYFNWTKVLNGTSSTVMTYATTETANDAIDWLSKRKADEPFLLWLAFNAPHSPFHAPPSNLHHQNLAGLDPTKTAQPFFDAAVEALDTELARVLAAAGTNVDVIFLGDNGTEGRVVRPPIDAKKAKDTLWEGGVHVPLCAYGPSVKTGEVSALVHTVDLHATLLQLLSAPAAGEDSVSILPYLSDPAHAPLRSTVYTEGEAAQAMGTATSGVTMRDDRYKLIRESTGTEWFFDLTTDPTENTNLVSKVGSDMTIQTAYQGIKNALKVLRPDLP